MFIRKSACVPDTVDTWWDNFEDEEHRMLIFFFYVAKIRKRLDP